MKQDYVRETEKNGDIPDLSFLLQGDEGLF